jgi:hypothetical protein
MGASFVFLAVFGQREAETVVAESESLTATCGGVLVYLASRNAVSTLTDRILVLLGRLGRDFQSLHSQETPGLSASVHPPSAAQNQPAGSLAAVSSSAPSAPKPADLVFYDFDGDFDSPAFVLESLALAAIYYLAVFDNEGTWQASWTQVLS